MIGKLVWENVKHRPLRTLLSALLIAIPVTLVLTLVGLSRGMLEESQRRATGVGADIIVRPKGSQVMSSFSSLAIPEKYVEVIKKQPHVTDATGVGVQNIKGFLQNAAGIRIGEFTRMSGGFDYLSGGPFERPEDVLVDDYYAAERNLSVGATIELFNRNWRVCGIVRSGKLNRIFVDLTRMQDLTSSSAKVSQIYVKVDDEANVAAAAEALRRLLPDHPVYPMREFTSLMSVDNVPEMKVFIQVMIGIAVVIGFAVVCLSMYMSVLQRTREIGILKSLGATKWFVLRVILREAVLLAGAGTIIGVILSFGSRWALDTFVPASFHSAVVPDWWPRAALIAFSGAILGALYPGWRAASQDPIEALAYE